MENIIKELNVEEDGVNGYIKDVTNENWYTNPNITLYDQLEYDSFNLACDYAELIGVHLDKEDIGDFSLAKEVQEAVITILTKRFGINFPGIKTAITYVVKREEEELGSLFMKVTVKNDTEATVMKNFEMASKYAQGFVCDWEYFDEEEKEEYDEHLAEMGEVRRNGNGDDAFVYYLENICGYTVEVVNDYCVVDFMFEW